MVIETLTSVDFWKYFSIPFVAALVGWGTNWLAIKLTFQPLEFKGIRPILGWQGIIPSKAAKMATTFAESAMFRLGTLAEIFHQMDPEAIAEHISREIDPQLETFTDEVLFYGGNGAVWRTMPKIVKARIYERVRGQTPRLINGLMLDVEEQIEDLMDFKDMLVTHLSADKALLNRLFLDAGREEFRFIVRSGLYFGFLFGLVQLVVWIFVEESWVLPLFGGLVGLLTNWIAINLIFRPLYPRQVGPWTVQGLFLKRQAEVAAIWCRIVTREIVTIRQIIEAMLRGPKSAQTQALIRKHLQPIADEALGALRPAAQLTVGEEALDGIRHDVADKAVAVSLEPFKHWGFIEDRAEVLEKLLNRRMVELAPDEFQDLLRPCFQEDEWKLILLGGVLGFLAGVAQLILIFGG